MVGRQQSEKSEKKCEIAISHFCADLNPYNHAGKRLGLQLSEKVRRVSARSFSKMASHFLTLLMTSLKPP